MGDSIWQTIQDKNLSDATLLMLMKTSPILFRRSFINMMTNLAQKPKLKAADGDFFHIGQIAQVIPFNDYAKSEVPDPSNLVLINTYFKTLGDVFGVSYIAIQNRILSLTTMELDCFELGQHLTALVKSRDFNTNIDSNLINQKPKMDAVIGQTKRLHNKKAVSYNASSEFPLRNPVMFTKDPLNLVIRCYIIELMFSEKRKKMLNVSDNFSR